VESKSTSECTVDVGPGEVRLPSVSVVIPSYRRADLLARCLSGVDRQQPPPDEIVVVYRRDDEETARFLEEWARQDEVGHRPVAVERPGYVAACAAGAEGATHDIVAYLDDDAVPRPGWLAALLQEFLDPTVGAAGGPYVDHLGERVVTGRTRRVGRVTWYGRIIGRHWLSTDYSGDVEWLTGANMALRRELAHFNQDLLPASTGLVFGVEQDACLTIRRLGYRVVFTPAALIDHYTTSFRDKDLGSRAVGADVSALAADWQYVLLKFLSRPGRLAFRLYGFGLGSASAPGPGRAVAELLRSPARSRAMARRVPLAWRGRLRGEQMYREWVKQNRPRPTRPGSNS
jgi:GT2 family glycosyltransferase